MTRERKRFLGIHSDPAEAETQITVCRGSEAERKGGQVFCWVGAGGKEVEKRSSDDHRA